MRKISSKRLTNLRVENRSLRLLQSTFVYTFVHEARKFFPPDNQGRGRDEARQPGQAATRSKGGVEAESLRRRASKSTRPETPKYRQVYEDLLAAINSGSFKSGDRLPNEAELGKHYNTSRITVAKAVNELQILGLVSRRAGSGTHVLGPAASAGRVSGLLIPDLEHTSVFS
jgi:hypothetical protein